jgi:hypothetical protein
MYKMVWPFSREPKQAELPRKLIYKSGQAFFEYQCKYGHTEIKPKHGIAALVLDPREEFGWTSSTKVQNDGSQEALLKVASEDGGFMVFATTPSGKGDPLEPGDVVIWVPQLYVMEAAIERADPRIGWVGFIVAKVKPEIGLDNYKPDFLCVYT